MADLDRSHPNKDNRNKLKQNEIVRYTNNLKMKKMQLNMQAKVKMQLNIMLVNLMMFGLHIRLWQENLQHLIWRQGCYVIPFTSRIGVIQLLFQFHFRLHLLGLLQFGLHLLCFKMISLRTHIWHPKQAKCAKFRRPESN